ALVIMDEREKDKIFMAKRGNPLVVGLAENENLVASDIPALLPYTKNVVFIEDGETAVITPNTFKLYSDKGEEITRPAQIIPWSPLMAERGGYKHFMLKEIHEQPIAIADTFAGRLRPSKHDIVFDEIKDLLPANDFPYDEITIIACGTSWHAGLIGKYFIESLARIRVNVELASEYRYRNPIINNRTFIIPISQSGETADTLAALNLAKEKKATIVSICNVVGSSITRASNATLYTHAGPEIGVASTKTFTSQLAVLIMFATYLAKHIKKIDEDTACKIVEELVSLPRKMRIVLERADQIKQIADEVLNSPSAIFIGRGVNYPIALEGALKLKEITYMHAEGFPAGELKHGPIALIDYGVPVIALVPQDSTYDKMLSNIEEVRARGANIIAIITNGNPDLTDKASHVISIPKASSYTTPILTSILVQLLAYYVADHKGTDVDQPRNLAKSVTVE
ncbi:MAG: glutamine--fructose-6-phosphate transaminase (isomerizing), partial [Deltaproteobacteria bacterium CG07_land_8_20_14_0_80_38_7]